MNINECIEGAYKALIKKHLATFEPAHEAKERAWFNENFPHLLRGRSLDRVLFDMNVQSRNLHCTGICLPNALFVQTYIKDVYNEDVEIIGLWEHDSRNAFTGHNHPPLFCHSVLKYNGKFHDAFWPEGTEDADNILYAKDCFADSVERIVSNFRRHSAKKFLVDEYFRPVKNELYQGSTDNYFQIIFEGA